MILRYGGYDILGNHFTLIIQGASRMLCDLAAQAEIDKFKKRLRFDLSEASVVDISNEAVLVSEAYDHEIGSTLFGGDE